MGLNKEEVVTVEEQKNRNEGKKITKHRGNLLKWENENEKCIMPSTGCGRLNWEEEKAGRQI